MDVYLKNTFNINMKEYKIIIIALFLFIFLLLIKPKEGLLKQSTESISYTCSTSTDTSSCIFNYIFDPIFTEFPSVNILMSSGEEQMESTDYTLSNVTNGGFSVKFNTDTSFQWVAED